MIETNPFKNVAFLHVFFSLHLKGERGKILGMLQTVRVMLQRDEIQ